MQVLLTIFVSLSKKYKFLICLQAIMQVLLTIFVSLSMKYKFLILFHDTFNVFPTSAIFTHLLLASKTTDNDFTIVR